MLKLKVKLFIRFSFIFSHWRKTKFFEKLLLFFIFLNSPCPFRITFTAILFCMLGIMSHFNYSNIPCYISNFFFWLFFMTIPNFYDYYYPLCKHNNNKKISQRQKKFPLTTFLVLLGVSSNGSTDKQAKRKRDFLCKSRISQKHEGGCWRLQTIFNTPPQLLLTKKNYLFIYSTTHSSYYAVSVSHSNLF